MALGQCERRGEWGGARDCGAAKIGGGGCIGGAGGTMGKGISPRDRRPGGVAAAAWFGKVVLGWAHDLARVGLIQGASACEGGSAGAVPCWFGGGGCVSGRWVGSGAVDPSWGNSPEFRSFVGAAGSAFVERDAAGFGWGGGCVGAQPGLEPHGHVEWGGIRAGWRNDGRWRWRRKRCGGSGRCGVFAGWPILGCSRGPWAQDALTVYGDPQASGDLSAS